jgi:cell division protein FtsB
METPTSLDTGPAARRRRGRRALESLLVCAGCILLLNAVVGERGLIAMAEARREHRALAQQVEALRLENARLREDTRRLRDDPAAIEEVARRELGLIRPG